MKDQEEEEDKLNSRRTYQNDKETNLTKRESLIANQDQTIFEEQTELTSS